MKWKTIGHEFDTFYEKHKDLKNIYLFGAGKKGNKYADILTRYCINIAGFIDNNMAKQNCYIEREEKKIPIMSLEDYKSKRLNDSYIVICVGDKFKRDIISQLKENGLVEHKDFCEADNDFEKILRVILMYKNNEIYIPLSQISLTERCTMRCKKCAHACNLVPRDRNDMTIEEARQSVDWFFKFVDYVGEFVLIGGEPFLYRYLKDVIHYTGNRYRNRMRIFSITTNGTLVPNDDVLRECAKQNILVRISNYTATHPQLVIRHKLLTDKLKEYGITYTMGDKEGLWKDYGFDYLDREATPTELEKVFDECFTPCHEIRGSKFYFCVMARSVAENMKHGTVGKNDYLDLATLSDNSGRRRFFEYAMGCSDKGYLDMCNFCNGANSVNHSIPVAEQM